MRIPLRCLIASFFLTLIVTVWILFFPDGSFVSFGLMFPAIWLTATLLGSLIATSDSAPANFIALVLASSVLNIALYAAAFYLLFKSWSFARQRRYKSRDL